MIVNYCQVVRHYSQCDIVKMVVQILLAKTGRFVKLVFTVKPFQRLHKTA